VRNFFSASSRPAAVQPARHQVDHLPEGCRADWRRRLRNAYAMSGYAEAKAALEKLWRQLVEINPSAARSLEAVSYTHLTLPTICSV